MDRREFEGRIIEKAQQDPAYRQRLLSDPKSVVAEELEKIRPGTTLPDQMKISVVQEDPDNLTIVLPINPADLTPDQLRGAAGGAQDVQANLAASVVQLAMIDGSNVSTVIAGIVESVAVA
jgi:hypothetical protein